ncbi:3,4-dihydroxy-2-butanone-4-phosphate synthase [Pneumocystis murina B123]|uniref:3,4-dihydroxy-2-butanone 4-phosphate synthase n=1 Tax=Pneumocystis murina (strain B123) TaxID=1069680 RepID=M7P7X3_PNEMU|nr:3,4-dihydroxy-2-butanone-4-phosphate synthase [Pneumocystis murina B123]EMR09975.1 3,4-dihydroxy-2-butanone-4-phosphate synthase [Pneumocystis murina B123]
MQDTIEAVLDDFRHGHFVLVMDDEDRENETDLILAAEFMTSEKMAFMVRYTTGIICVPLPCQRLDQLKIPLMVKSCENTENMGTAFTIPVDFKDTSTGVSAQDRALTVRMLVDPSIVNPQMFRRPGHVFPLKAMERGLLDRQGHTEAAIDLCRLSGLKMGAAISELIKEDGSMARRKDCEIFSKKYGIKMITISSLVKYISDGRFYDNCC